MLIVGLGSIGKRHLRLIRQLLPTADIRVLRHTHATIVSEYASGYFYEMEEAIVFAPQIAIIANPAPFHIQAALALANIGTHLLIEKPLSSSLNGVSELLRVCKERNIILFTGYNLRFLPSLQVFRKLLAEGIVGNHLSVRCEVGQYLPSWRPNIDYRQSVSARQDLGGGVLLELSHELDYLRWIFGEVIWVRATLSKQSDLEINVEDTAHLILGFDRKLNGLKMIGQVNLDFIRHDSVRKCTVIGNLGSLRWDGLTGQIELHEAGKKDWKELFNQPHQSDESYIEELRCFTECVLAKKSPPITGEDGLAVLKIIDAARKSSQFDGQMIEVSKI